MEQSNSSQEYSVPTGNSPRIIAVTSGKGGVGKTNISINLAIALSKLNKRVCIFDADLGLANINILLGINPEFDIQHVISGEKEIRDIVIQTSEGVQIIPGSSGIQQLADLNKEQVERLILSFKSLTQKLDFFFIDTSAGISSSVLSFVMAAHESIVVVTREPTSLTDGYSLIKVITSLGHRKKINIMVNMVRSPGLAKIIFQKLFDASKKHLNIELKYLGTILTDPNLTEAVCQQRPVLSLYPKSSSSKMFTALATVVCDQPVNKTESEETISSFWIRALKILRTPLKISQKTDAPASYAKREEINQHNIKLQPDIMLQPPISAHQEQIKPEKGSDGNKNGVQGVIYKIADMITRNQFSSKDFLEFNEADKSHVERLDLFLNKYYQFLEMAFIAGKGKYFIELDFDNRLNQWIEKSKLNIEDLANPFINSISSVLKKMVSMDVITRKTQLKDSLFYGDVTGITKLCGHDDILVSIGFPKECIQYIVSNLFGEKLNFLADDGSLNSAIRDGVGEITNVVVGEARRELSDKGFDFKAPIPEVVASHNYSLEKSVKDSFLIIPFLTNKGVISLSIGIIDKKNN